jgi:hypothetical protein
MLSKIMKFARFIEFVYSLNALSWICRLRWLERQAMLVVSQGMMNMFQWLTRQLMLVGRSKHPFRGLVLPKVRKFCLGLSYLPVCSLNE